MKAHPKILVIGGTGVIGSAFQAEAPRRGLEMASLSLDPDFLGNGFRNLKVDVASLSQQEMKSLLVAEQPTRIMDLLGLPDHLAQIVADHAAAEAVRVALISSCLLYDHDGSGEVDENCPTIGGEAALHPYQATKLARELFWRGRQDVDWCILRTHHVLGRGALLGCIPPLNRDPDLLDALRANRVLGLAAAGEIKLSYIHPADFAANALELMEDDTTRHTILPLVHPVPVKASAYYSLVAEALGLPPPEIISAKYEATDFWACTARDNVFVARHPSIRKLRFSHDIVDCIRDALTLSSADYRRAGGFMAQRIAGTTER
jgi:nucleoside-diphosphate-sugar epimerase